MRRLARVLRGIARLLLALALALAVLFAIHWMVSDRLPPVLQHPVAAWRLVRSEAPTRLAVPVAAIARSQLRDTWNAPRSGGRRHRGIDIFSPRGRPVLSATAGIVITVGENELGGRVVRVLGPGGHWHYYAHLEEYGPIRPGQIVRAGDVLGFVGTSGNARGTPPHLHYGIYKFAGGAVNPYPLLAGRP